MVAFGLQLPPWRAAASIFRGTINSLRDGGFFITESFQPESRHQKTRNHSFPRTPEGPCWKSSSRPQWHQGFIPFFRINPECRTWTEGSGRRSCSGQLLGHGFQLGFLWAAQKTVFVFVNDLPPSQLCFFSTCFWLTRTRALRFITSRWSVQSGLGCLFWGGCFFWHIEKDEVLPLCSPPLPMADTVHREEKPWPSRGLCGTLPLPKLINEGLSMAAWPGHRPQSPAGSLGSTRRPATSSFSGHQKQPGREGLPWQHEGPEDRWWSAEYEASQGGEGVPSSLLKASREEGTPGFCWKIQNPGTFKRCSWK